MRIYIAIKYYWKLTQVQKDKYVAGVHRMLNNELHGMWLDGYPMDETNYIDLARWRVMRILERKLSGMKPRTKSKEWSSFKRNDRERQEW
jgi:hypothetical protein